MASESFSCFSSFSGEINFSTLSSFISEVFIAGGMFAFEILKCILDSLMPLSMRNMESRAAKITYDSTAEWSTSFQRIPAATHSESDSEDDDAAPIRTLFSPTLHSTSNNSEFVGLEIEQF